MIPKTHTYVIHGWAKLHFCVSLSSIQKTNTSKYYTYITQQETPPIYHDCMAESLSRNWLKFSSVSNMLILTYFGLTPKCIPLLVKMLYPRRKLSQSSTFPSHFNHTKAVKYVYKKRNELEKIYKSLFKLNLTKIFLCNKFVNYHNNYLKIFIWLCTVKCKKFHTVN